MNSIEIIKEMINGCENVIADTKENDGVVWLAKEVRKDLIELMRVIQIEQGRIG